MLTVGVEEEFLLLDPGGDVAPAAPAVLRLTGPGDERGEIKPELMTYQVETSSGVCTDLGDLEHELTGLRNRIAGAAAEVGVRMVASGRPPFGNGGLEMLSDEARYREMAARFPTATASSGTCACQVHIGIPDRDVAVQVLTRLRSWLPTLLAMSGNSPFAHGRDTGWSSGRYRGLLSWPTFRPPAALGDAASYDRMTTALVARGLALDPRSVYLLARISPRHPTIEIRVADTLPTAADATLIAGVLRGLVATLLDDVRGNRPSVPAGGAGSLRARLLAAARRGLDVPPAQPREPDAGGRRTASGVSVDELIRYILPALEAAGDAARVLAGVARLERLGTGAHRQRQLWSASGSGEDFVAGLARAAMPDGVTIPRPAGEPAPRP